MATNGYNMTSINPYQWGKLIDNMSGEVITPALNGIKTAIEGLQLNEWRKILTGGKNILWGGWNCREVLCVVRQTTGQKPATTFILPYSTMGANIPIVDGLYYNANYYYSFGIQSGMSNLYVSDSWCRGYENGVVRPASDFVFDVYIR